jgi:solute carrier family 25 protein 39/40
MQNSTFVSHLSTKTFF